MKQNPKLLQKMPKDIQTIVKEPNENMLKTI